MKLVERYEIHEYLLVYENKETGGILRTDCDKTTLKPIMEMFDFEDKKQLVEHLRDTGYYCAY